VVALKIAVEHAKEHEHHQPFEFLTVCVRMLVATCRGDLDSRYEFVVQKRFPQYAIPDGEVQPSEEKIDNSKAERELGLHVLPLEETLVDMAVTLISLGLAHPILKK
jgi:hypothetical protein